MNYTVTVKIAPKDATYLNPQTAQLTSSAAGHAWYSISDGGAALIALGFSRTMVSPELELWVMGKFQL
jgi:hypothetical protein